jgi:glycosyltransferase involved in cell wall biosynthesis
MAVVFFHQNEVAGAQGGIERYLSTLLEEAGDRGLLITETCLRTKSVPRGNRIVVPLPWRGKMAKWLSYIIGVIFASGKIRCAIARLGKCTLEFSRPEYVFFSWMFHGAKVFTIHGTGPARSEGIKYWVHYLSCLMLPLAADVIQIVGRDKGGLPPRTCSRMAGRLRYIDAWYDASFCMTAFPSLLGPLRVFYAGRLAPMKNPDLLFKIVDAASRSPGHQFEFRYFGADEAKIPAYLREGQFNSGGLLDEQQMAKAIADCHMGILCSGYGEGSPFIVVEALACGRGFILPPLPGLLDAYRGFRGIVFAEAHTIDAFVEALGKMETTIRSGLRPEDIANQVSDRSKKYVARKTLQLLEADHG